MVKKLVLILFVLFVAFFSFSQDYSVPDADSIEKNIKTLNLSEKAYQLARLSLHYVKDDTLKAHQLIEEASALISDKESAHTRGLLFLATGIIESQKNNLTEALSVCLEAENLLIEAEDYLTLGHLYNEIVWIYFFTGNIREAFNYTDNIVHAYEKSKSFLDVARTYWGIGFFLNNFSSRNADAIRVLKKAYHIADSINAPSKYLGGILASLGFAYEIKGDEDSALFYVKKSLNTFNDSIAEDYLHKTQVTWEYANWLIKFGEPQLGLKYANIALERSEKYSYIWGKKNCASQISKAHYEMGNMQKAIEWKRKELYYASLTDSVGSYFLKEEYRHLPGFMHEINRKHSPAEVRNQAKISIKNAASFLSKFYEETNNLEKAIEYEKLYSAYNDSLQEESKLKELLGLEILYDTRRKEEQIESLSKDFQFKEFKLKQNRSMLFGIGGTIFLILLFAILFLRQNQLKSKQGEIYLEQRLLQMQMNPHFIFNALSNIRDLVYQNDNIKASQFLSRFAGLLRSILESSREELIPVEKEIESLQNYVEIQKLRFKNEFNFNVEADPEIDQEYSLIPPMVLQPFIENIIEEGIKKMSDKNLEIGIKFSINNQLKKGNQMLVEIVSNQAIGNLSLKMDNNVTEEKKSLPANIIKEQIEILSKRYKIKPVFEISEMPNNKGSRILIGLPYLDGN